jgi:hypothetical protein
VPELLSQAPPASTALEEAFPAFGVGFEEVGFVVDEPQRAAALEEVDVVHV